LPDVSTQVSTDECQRPCPGYPSDVCGGDGLYGYMTLARAPSGTLHPSAPSQASRSSTVRKRLTAALIICLSLRLRYSFFLSSCLVSSFPGYASEAVIGGISYFNVSGKPGQSNGDGDCPTHFPEQRFPCFSDLFNFSNFFFCMPLLSLPGFAPPPDFLTSARYPTPTSSLLSLTQISRTHHQAFRCHRLPPPSFRQ
jgi:hypothetical protein